MNIIENVTKFRHAQLTSFGVGVCRKVYDDKILIEFETSEKKSFDISAINSILLPVESAQHKESKSLMKKVLEKCDWLLDDQVFSKELLTKTIAEFFSVTSNKEQHNTGLLLHTGSIIYDAVAIAYAAISNLVLNQTFSEDIVRSLEKGDYVLYGVKQKQRYIYNGIVIAPFGTPGEFAVLSQSNGNDSYVPQKLWRHISPYNGHSTRTDGRGLHKMSGLRELFLKEVLGFDDSQITSVVDTSTVIIMPRERADKIIKELAFSFNGMAIPLRELVTASYYTENEEFYYAGNSGKTDPVLKVTVKASNARDLMRKKDGNRTIGLFVLGNDVVSRNITELPEMIKRRSLRYAYILTHIDSEHAVSILNEYDDMSLLACTKDFLLSNSMPTQASNQITNELSRQVDAVIERQLDEIVVEGHFSWEQYKLFRKAMYIIKKSDYDSEEKEEFIIQSYALMNLFLTSVFKITEVERLIDDGKIDIISPSDRINLVNKSAQSFPLHLKDHVKYVVDMLEQCYLFLTEKSNKQEMLRELIRVHQGKQIAIVVPKAYYTKVLMESDMYSEIEDKSMLTIVPVNRFDNKKMYDVIIAVGDISGKKFDVFRSRAARHLITLLYDFETNLYKFKLKKAEKTEKAFDERASFEYAIESEYEDLYYDSNETQIEIEQLSDMVSEVDEYVYRINELSDLKTLGFSGGYSASTTDIVAVTSFETGEKALFTKMYKPYVFDELSGEVKETELDSICEGDAIVFTRSNDETRDIVDDLLVRLIQSGQLSEDVKIAFKMSKHWKEVLQKYMETTGISAKEVATRMIKNGVSVQEITIRTWLDPDSRTVGPKKRDSIEQIALLVDDEEMFEDAEKYFDACARIRRIRRKILSEIGKAIISKLSGHKPADGTIISEIYGRLDSLARILTVESITFVSHTVPLNTVNKPLVVKE